MTEGKGFPGPPTPSLPERAPWEAVQLLADKLDKLINVMQVQMGITAITVTPGAAPVPGRRGAPATIGGLVMVMQELVPEILGASQIIPFQKTIATSYQDEQDRDIRFTGTVRDVIMAFPAGCQQLVEVRMIYFPAGGGGSYIIPTVDDTFIALDDFTVVFQPRYIVAAPGRLRVEWWNYDSLNTHSVPVIATLVPTALEVQE